MVDTAPGERSFGDLDREIVRLALPALGALIAEPLYVLADTAVVGHLGTPELGGLALASQVLLGTLSLFIFLAYGTTAAVARLSGAGKLREAADQAVQSIWLATALGIGFAAIGWVAAEPLLRLLRADGEVLVHATTYLQISVLGLPAMFVTLSAVGYLRGRKDTLRPLIVSLVTAAFNLALELVLIYGLDQGIGASALSTVMAQWLGVSVYLWWVARDVATFGVGLAPDPGVIGRLAVAGVDLFVRTSALRASFIVATAVAASIGVAELAAHQIAFELWSFLALALDSLAIAAQALVGNLLGAGDAAGARRVGQRVIRWGLGAGILATAIVLALRGLLPGIFTDDPEVVALAGVLLVWLAVMQPLGGVVFALDGILIGAGDLRYLAKAMAFAGAGFLGMAVAVVATDSGIGWLWAAITGFMVLRLVPLMHRFLGDRWMVTGAWAATESTPLRPGQPPKGR